MDASPTATRLRRRSLPSCGSVDLRVLCVASASFGNARVLVWLLVFSMRGPQCLHSLRCVIRHDAVREPLADVLALDHDLLQRAVLLRVFVVAILADAARRTLPLHRVFALDALGSAWTKQGRVAVVAKVVVPLQGGGGDAQGENGLTLAQALQQKCKPDRMFWLCATASCDAKCLHGPFALVTIRS